MGLVLVVHPRLQPHQLCLCCTVRRRKDRKDWYRSPVVKGLVPELDIDFCALVDTGADVDIMSHQMLHRMEQELKQRHVKCREEHLRNGAQATVYPDARVAIIKDISTKRVLLPSGQVIATNRHVVMEYELQHATESCQEWMAIRGSHSFLVLPNRTYDVILGAPWLTRYRVNLDFSTRRLLAHEGLSLSAADLDKSAPMGGGMIYLYPVGE